jgi:hypothetical protein
MLGDNLDRQQASRNVGFKYQTKLIRKLWITNEERLKTYKSQSKVSLQFYFKISNYLEFLIFVMCKNNDPFCKNPNFISETGKDYLRVLTPKIF